MLPVANLLGFVVAALVIIVIPGPSVLFAIGRALSIGRGHALLSVTGNTLGVFVQAVVISLGLGAIIGASDVFFIVIRLLGAAFLVFLGIQAIVLRKRHAGGGGASRRPWWRSLLEGVAVGITNPKSAVFFIAILPQFIDRSAGGIAVQLILLAAVFCAIGIVSDSLWAIGAGAARAWFAKSPRRIEVLTACGGAALIVLGVVLALTGLTDVKF